MNIRSIKNSIRWKIVLIYCILVFIATTIVGVFLMSRMEEYYINSARTNMRKLVEESSLTASVGAYDPFDEFAEEIQASIDAWSPGFSQEIFVVDETFYIVAASNASSGQSAVDFLDCNIILSALSGEEAESHDSISSQTSDIPVFNMAFPIKNESGKVIGALYLREDITSLEDSIDQSKSLFAKAMVLAVFVTFVLGFVISKSITGPINDVTKKAEQMASGDFSQEVSVKSNDEIGRLAEMFNYLRKQLDDTLSEISGEKNKLETILRHMADGLIAVDLSGKIIHANHAAIKILAVNEQSIEEENYDDLIQGLNPELTVENLMKRCEFEPESEVFESAGRYYDIRYDRFKDENGKDVGLIMIIQDITQRMKLESMQMDFVANVSHELKTPLTSISGFAELMKNGNVAGETVVDFSKSIYCEAQRLISLVNDIIKISELDEGNFLAENERVDLYDLAGEIIERLKSEAAKKNISFSLIGSQAEVLGVPKILDEMLYNICDNAVKYNKENGTVDIIINQTDKKVNVIVRDTGIGIPQEHQQRVFERFYRVDKSHSKKVGGTGLGLAIVKHGAIYHNAEIKLESEENKGTTITLTFDKA